MKHPVVKLSVSIRMSKFYHFTERTYVDETNHSHDVFSHSRQKQQKILCFWLNLTINGDCAILVSQ
jgi:hypothetical protein